MAELFENKNDVDKKPFIVKFFGYLMECLFCGLVCAGCLTIIVVLCKICYNIIWGG